MQAAILDTTPRLPPHHPRHPRRSPVASGRGKEFEKPALVRLPGALLVLDDVVVLVQLCIFSSFARDCGASIRKDQSENRAREKVNTHSPEYLTSGLCKIG